MSANGAEGIAISMKTVRLIILSLSIVFNSPK